MNQQLGLFGNDKIVDDDRLTDYIKGRINMLVDERSPSRFIGSCFYPLITVGPHQRGIVGERIVRMLAIERGYYVEKSKSADIRINGHDIEVKFARQKEDGGFIVNQIRDQQYKYMVIVAITPDRAFIFTVPKVEIIRFGTGQHGGNSAQETRIYVAKDLSQLIKDLNEYAGLDRFYKCMAG